MQSVNLWVEKRVAKIKNGLIPKWTDFRIKSKIPNHSPYFFTEQQIRKVMKASQRSEIQRSISPIEEMENHASPAPANGGYVYDG